MDICDIILDQHAQQRRMFAVLDDFPRDDHRGLGAIWRQLEGMLELHARAEELYYYPELVKLGTGAGDAPSDSEEVEDAIHDHNEIRDGIKKVRGLKVGSHDWWQAVIDVRVTNSDHMAEEERQDLADFRQQASLGLRHTIGVLFVKYYAEHSGEILEGHNLDAGNFIEKNRASESTPAETMAETLHDQQTATRASSRGHQSVQASETESAD